MSDVYRIWDAQTRTIVECTDEHECVEFYYSDGNMACDCNRGLEFSRTKGSEDWDIKCGHERFVIVYHNRHKDIAWLNDDHSKDRVKLAMDDHSKWIHDNLNNVNEEEG